MRITIRESARSTADRPRFCWHVHDGRLRPAAFGVCESREEAEAEAEQAFWRLEASRPWLPPVIYGGDDE